MAKPDVPTLSKFTKVPKMSVSQTASMRQRRGGADWPHTASRRTHARPRLEAATLRVRAATKVRAYVARVMRRVAAGEAPAVSTVATEPAASTRQRTARCGLKRFPEDALGAIIAFVDLPMRFTCVVASRTLRDACMRLSPRLEYELVLKRFPLLTALPIRTSLAGVPAPRELFRSYRGRFNGRIFRAPQPNPTISLDAYTLALELEVLEGADTTRESVYVRSGAISWLVATSTSIGASFNIPEVCMSALLTSRTSGSAQM